ncbi:nucleotide disphospho-sugar-binding domain-containing protein [Pseudonocardia kongjuensis]|uniref:nucleotide disphospho-sugar-binding domain-containing protein n=1 Tax=Pseudonocardia kongjuensis TaxID=102227 RepID=UPI0031DC6E02
MATVSHYVPLGAGHVNPTLGIVAELVRRGHRVTSFVPERFAALPAATGARVVPVPSTWEAHGLADPPQMHGRHLVRDGVPARRDPHARPAARPAPGPGSGAARRTPGDLGTGAGAPPGGAVGGGLAEPGQQPALVDEPLHPAEPARPTVSRHNDEIWLLPAQGGNPGRPGVLRGQRRGPAAGHPAPGVPVRRGDLRGIPVRRPGARRPRGRDRLDPAAGVPLVALPQMAEQRANADRIAELGLGVTLDPATLTPDRLWSAVQQVSTDPAVRERLSWMAGEIAAAGGAPAAADEIERALPPTG